MIFDREKKVREKCRVNCAAWDLMGNKGSPICIVRCIKCGSLKYMYENGGDIEDQLRWPPHYL